MPPPARQGARCLRAPSPIPNGGFPVPIPKRAKGLRSRQKKGRSLRNRPRGSSYLLPRSYYLSSRLCSRTPFDMNRRLRLGDLQIAILRVLWEEGEATVARVHEALAGKRRAPTTIATMLSKMEKRGIVEHRVEGRPVGLREPDVHVGSLAGGGVRRELLDDEVLRGVLDSAGRAGPLHGGGGE